jgi:hypothetical protein
MKTPLRVALMVAPLLALGIGLAGAFAQGAGAGQGWRNRDEIWLALYPDDPTNPNNPGYTADPHMPVKAEIDANRRYHWTYNRTDPRTGMPQQIPEGDERIREINDYRVQCINLTRDMYEHDGVPAHIPAAQFDNLEDQAAEIVLACVNTLHLRKLSKMRGVGVIVCEQHTNHCWGPNNVWYHRIRTIR